jgi:hypothetical protein
VQAALENLARDLDVGLARVAALGFRPIALVLGDVADLCCDGGMLERQSSGEQPVWSCQVTQEDVLWHKPEGTRAC